MLTEFVLSTERRGSSMLVACSGEFDVATRGRLEEALASAIAIAENPQSLIFDGTRISLLTSPGTKTSFELVQTCKRRWIELQLRLSNPARRVLDLVGLRWLGVVDGGLAVEDPLTDALRANARLSPQELSTELSADDKNGGDYFLG